MSVWAGPQGMEPVSYTHLEYRLEVLRDVTPGAVEQGRRYIDEKRVCIDLKEGIAEKLYIEVDVYKRQGVERAFARRARGRRLAALPRSLCILRAGPRGAGKA